MLTPTALGSAVESVKLVVVAPAAMVPTAAKLGTKAAAAPAAKVPPKPGLTASCQLLVTMLKRLRMAALTRL